MVEEQSGKNYFLFINELKSLTFLNTGLTKSPSILGIIGMLFFTIFDNISKVSSKALNVFYIIFLCI